MTVNIVDVVLLALFAIFIIEGYRRGFILSLLGIARAIISIPLAYFVSKYFAAPVYDAYLHERIVTEIGNSIENSGGVENFIKSIQDGSEPLLSNVSGSLSTAGIASLSPAEAAQLITDKLLEPVIMPAIKLILFFATLFVFYLITAVVAVIIKRFSKRDKTPLKTANKVLGAVLGTLKGIIVLVVISALASVLVSINMPNDNDILSSFEDSSVINFINNENPFLDYLED